MSIVVRRSFVPLVAGLLVIGSGSAAWAQAVVESEPPEATQSPTPGIAEVALCEMPELGEPAGSLGPLLASIADVPLRAAPIQEGAVDGSAGAVGCRLPTATAEDVFDSEEPIELSATNDLAGDGSGSPGILRVLHGPRPTSGKDAGKILKDKQVEKFGKVTKKTLTGDDWLICVELEQELQPGDSVIIATDIKGDPTRRAPSSVETPTNPLANVRDLYHLARLASDGSVVLGNTDLSTGKFFTGKRPFAAALRGTKAYFLIPRDGLGEDFRAGAFRSDAGSDVAGLGAAALIPTDGTAGWLAECLSHLLIHEALEFEGVTFPSQGEVDVCFSASDADLDLIDSWLKDLDSDVATGTIAFTLREGERSIEERLPIEVFIEDGRVYFTLLVGYSAYGYHVLEGVEGVEFPPTGSERLDELFDAAARTIERGMSPVSFAEQAGFLQDTAPCVERA